MTTHLTKGAKIAIFLLGGQNRNILKLRRQKVQFSQIFIILNVKWLAINPDPTHFWRV